MLFNSYVFIFLFLPAVLAGFYLLARIGGQRAARIWLALSSLSFYAYWNVFGIGTIDHIDFDYFFHWLRWRYVFMFVGSMVVNYLLGLALARGAKAGRPSRILLALGLLFDVGLLCFFKYAGFFENNVNWVLHTEYSTFQDILLPIGISFYTFHQIGFLVDAYRGTAEERSFFDYFLFITAFWQLIAGPIVRYNQIIPQLRKEYPYRFHRDNFSIGVTTFTIGLFKKLVLADSLAVFANYVFGMSKDGAGYHPTTVEAWVGALCYMHQVYFDFSGYSDMAIGLGRMFNIAVPSNFNSPYKSVSIIQFWRRWHITLSLFLREFVYYPLGGNRGSKFEKYRNLMITMILAGFWHGANWTFIIFGLIHGSMLIINHWWREIQGKSKYDQKIPFLHFCGYVLFTYMLVCVTLVIFRANSVADAATMYRAMFFLDGHDPARLSASFDVGTAMTYYLIGLFIVWFLPNTNQFMNIIGPGETRQDNIEWGLSRWLRWKPNLLWAVIIALMFVIALVNLPKANEFLYFQF